MRTATRAVPTKIFSKRQEQALALQKQTGKMPVPLTISNVFFFYTVYFLVKDLTFNF
jgi:hypothetical protein